MVKIVVENFSEDALKKLYCDLDQKEDWTDNCELCEMPTLLHNGEGTCTRIRLLMRLCYEHREPWFSRLYVLQPWTHNIGSYCSEIPGHYSLLARDPEYPQRIEWSQSLNRVSVCSLFACKQIF